MGDRQACTGRIKNILKANGLDPCPNRGVGTWDEFLKLHAATCNRLACAACELSGGLEAAQDDDLYELLQHFDRLVGAGIKDDCELKRETLRVLAEVMRSGEACTAAAGVDPAYN